MPDPRRRLRASLAAGTLACGLITSVGCASDTGSTVTPATSPSAAPADSAPARAPVTHAASFLGEGLVTCFPEGTMRNDKPDQPAVCEVSAVAVVGEQVLLASDKEFPGAGRSSIFQVPLTLGDKPALGAQPVGFLTAPAITASIKYEDFTKTPAGDRVFITTGFDRVKDDGSWDGYNALLTWKTDAPGEVAVVTTPDAVGAASSVSLRAAFSAALLSEAAPEGQPYFKVEGLVAVGEDRLLFGIREQGASYKEFEYSIDVVEARYGISDAGAVTIDPASVKRLFRGPATLVLGHRVALSSLALDEAGGRLMMLTSYEHEGTDSHVGGFLFAVPLSAIEANDGAALAAGIVRAADGFPFLFGHKPEGIAALDGGRWLVVHDDDRVTSQKDIGLKVLSFERGLHQAAYTILHVP